MNKRGFPYLFFIILTISGCTNEKWYKEGGTEKERARAEIKCHALSLKQLPPDNKIDNKNHSGSTELKKQSFDEDSDTDYEYIDANEEARIAVFKDCMYDAGWDSKSQSGGLSNLIQNLM